MSRQSRAVSKATARWGADARPATLLRSPADVAAMIPYVLGYHPTDSLVLVALEGPRKCLGPTLRVDLVDDRATVWRQAGKVLEIATRNRVGPVLVVAYSEEPARADPLVGMVLEGLAAHGIAVEDALRVGSRRWWSYVCRNPACCGPDGTPFEPATSRVAAEAVLAGLSVAPDRDALRGLFAPGAPDRRREVDRAARWLRRTDPTVRPLQACARMRDKVTALLAAPSDLGPADVGWLALAVQSFRGQDAAIALVERPDAARHFKLWRRVMCLVGDDLLPPVGCIAAFSVWLDGRGVLASHAIERVFEVAPYHPLARQLNVLLVDAVNPRTWAARDVEVGVATAADGGHA